MQFTPHTGLTKAECLILTYTKAPLHHPGSVVGDMWVTFTPTLKPFYSVTAVYGGFNVIEIEAQSLLIFRQNFVQVSSVCVCVKFYWMH